MNIRSIIIDDEPNNIENVRMLLATYCPEVKVVATAQHADEGIAAIRLHTPDLVFLDIQMPDKSGFDLLRAFTQIDFEIIFITAHDQYGIQAIKFSALDYLLKPVVIEELKSAVSKAINKIAGRQGNRNIENLLDYIRKGRMEPPSIALPTFEETRYVRVDEITRCEASNNYTTVCMQHGEQVLVCKTLKEFAELLKSHGFVRSHQSHLVNMRFIKSLLKEDGGTLLMKDQTKIPISRQKKEEVKDALKKYL